MTTSPKFFAGPQPSGAPAAKRPARFFARTENGIGTLLIYDDIGESFWTLGVTAKSVNDALDQLRDQGAKALHVFINSLGGDVFEGNTIFAAIKRWDRGEKVVWIDGVAASIASVIAMAGDKIKMSSAGLLMIHKAWGGVVGNSEELRKRAGLLDKIDQSLLETYQKRSGQAAADIERWMVEETWMSASEAKARNFVDEIVDEEPADDEATTSAAAAALLPMLQQQFRNAPPAAAALIARASARMTAHLNPAPARAKPAATSRPTPASPALTPKETTMNLKELLAKAVAAGLMTQEQSDAMLAAQAKLEEAVAKGKAVESDPELAGVKAKLDGAIKALERVAAPCAAVSVLDEAAGAGAAPRPTGTIDGPAVIAKFNMPKALVRREERSDDRLLVENKGDKRALRGMAFSRLVMGFVMRKEIMSKGGHCSMAEAIAALGFVPTADRFNNAAAGQGAAAGESWVPIDFQMDYIDALEAYAKIRALIPDSRRVQSQREAIAWPVDNGSFTAAAVGRGQAPAGSLPSTGHLMLRARRYAAEALIEKAWLREAIGNPDQFVRAKLALRGAQLEDLWILQGKGTENEPKGLVNWAKNTGAATAQPEFLDVKRDLQGAMKRIEVDNVDIALGLAHVGTVTQKWGLAGFENTAGTDFPFEREVMAGRLMGNPAAFTNIAGADNTKFVTFAPAESIIFDHLALSFEEDNTYKDAAGVTHSASAVNQTVIRVWREMDFGLEHGEAADVLTAVPWGQ